jgi:hypothetical protein
MFWEPVKIVARTETPLARWRTATKAPPMKADGTLSNCHPARGEYPVWFAVSACDQMKLGIV